MEDFKNLVKVSTYAREMNVSVTWVHKLAEKKEIQIVNIDGVKFVKKKQED